MTEVIITEEPRAQVEVNEQTAQIIVTGLYGPKGEPGPPGDGSSLPDWVSGVLTQTGAVVAHTFTLWRALEDTLVEPTDDATSDWEPVTMSSTQTGQFFGLLVQDLQTETSDRQAGDTGLQTQIDEILATPTTAPPQVFVQSVPDTVWNFNHTLPFIPAVEVLDDMDHFVLAEVRFPDSVTVQVGPFPIPSTGKVVIR